MEKDSAKLIIEIPEVPLRSLDSNVNAAEKIDQVKKVLTGQDIVFRSHLGRNE